MQALQRTFQRRGSRKGFFNCQHTQQPSARSPRQVTLFGATSLSRLASQDQNPDPRSWSASLRQTTLSWLSTGPARKLTKYTPGEFVLDPNDAGFPDSGLSYRTKFNLNAQVKLPFSHEWFEKAPGFAGHIPLPKMGVLHPSYMAAVTAASQLVKGP